MGRERRSGPAERGCERCCQRAVEQQDHPSHMVGWLAVGCSDSENTAAYCRVFLNEDSWDGPAVLLSRVP